MAPTSTSLAEQQPFTFTSPVSAETHEDALEFDYESWIQQSKVTNCYSKQWLEDADAQAIHRHHREMMLQAMDNLPEEAYELSLRDLSELSLSSRAKTTDESSMSSSLRSSAGRSPSNTKPWRKTTPSMEGAGFILKLFMPSPSRAAAAAGGGRKKSFSSSTVSYLRGNGGSVNDPNKSNEDTINRYLQTLTIASVPGTKNCCYTSSFHILRQLTNLPEIKELLSILQFQQVQSETGSRWPLVHLGNCWRLENKQ